MAKKRRIIGQLVLGIVENQMGRNGGFRCVLCFWGCDPLPAWDWDWVTQGSPKRHSRVTLGPRKGRIEEVSLFAMKVEKCRVGRVGRPAGRHPSKHKKCIFGSAAAAEPIPRALFRCSAHSRQKRARMGARKHSQIYGPLGMATLR
jgi:hypothetical protein